MLDNRKSTYEKIFNPFVPEKRRDGPTIQNHLGTPISASYGSELSSYDIRLREPITLIAGRMVIGKSLEYITMPVWLAGSVTNKSTNLRLGIHVFGELEPGWDGVLDVEVQYVPIEGGPSVLPLPEGWGIAAVKIWELRQYGDYRADPTSKYLGDTDSPFAR